MPGQESQSLGPCYHGSHENNVRYSILFITVVPPFKDSVEPVMVYEISMPAASDRPQFPFVSVTNDVGLKVLAV
jgi:hypothetical protein